MKSAASQHSRPLVSYHSDRKASGFSHRGNAVVPGLVDDQFRALIRINVSSTRDGTPTEIVAWIDTAFNGGLTVPRKQIDQLGLVKESSAEAILADGRLVELETFACFIDWFGLRYETQIIASDGEYPLLGTVLLSSRRLEIDYPAKTVNLV